MPEYNSQRRGTAHTLPKIFVLFYVLFVLCRSVYCLCVNVYCTTATEWQSNCSLTNLSYHMPSKALEMGICFHRDPVLGNMGERSFPTAFERRMKFLFLSGELLLRNSRDMYKKAVEMANSLHRGPHWWTWKGFVYQDFLRDRWMRALETEHLLLN